MSLELDLGDPKICESVLKALRPDNVEVPPFIVLRDVCKDGKLLLSLRSTCSKPREVVSLRNTVDDYLAHLQVSLQALKSTES